MLRRSALMALSGVAATGVLGCTRRERTAIEPPVVEPPLPPLPPMPEAAALPRGEVGTEVWTFDGSNRAVVIVPSWGTKATRFPVLFALHGRGEANKGPDAGVMGWPRDYALLRAIERVCAPPLTSADFETFVDTSHLADVNRELVSRPFEGLVVVCPYSPDLDLRKPGPIKEYGAYLLGRVLPRVRAELPVLASAQATGIDGVSLGGAIALRVGLGNPDAFGAVGSLQPAIGEDQVAEFAELAKVARSKNPSLHLRLLTSKEDYFRNAIGKTSAAWRAAGVDHDYADIPGPHDYPFNRGPGAIEMLLWHDRRLARA